MNYQPNIPQINWLGDFIEEKIENQTKRKIPSKQKQNMTSKPKQK